MKNTKSKLEQIELQQHETARNVIEQRWLCVSFHKIAQRLGIPLSEIRILRTTSPYEQQVWAEYGRSPYLFNQYKTRELCVKHISRFFGISNKKADNILGKDFERYARPIVHTQIEMNL